MKRQFILHLGLSKTGTTNLQVFFRRNPNALASAGIHYPNIWEGISNHSGLERTVLRPHAGREANHLALALEIRAQPTGPAHGAVDTPLWTNAFRLIDESGAHTAIISYENFYERPETFRFDVLRSRLGEFDVSGIIYLRRQEDWVTSLYAQSIRGTARLAIPFAKFVAGRRNRLAYSVLLDAVKEHIPLNILLVANYDLAARGGLLRDFLERTGLPANLAQLARDHEGRNSSLPVWATLFLLRCNQGELSDEAFVEVNKALGRVAGRSERILLRAGLDIATPAERNTLSDIAADDAARLFLRHGIALSPAAPGSAAYRPFDHDDFKTIKDLIARRLSPPTLAALDRV